MHIHASRRMEDQFSDAPPMCEADGTWTRLLSSTTIAEISELFGPKYFFAAANVVSGRDVMLPYARHLSSLVAFFTYVL